MPACQCCNLSESNRLELDREIVRGKNLSKLAKEYGVSYQSVYNHSKHHIHYQLKSALEHKQAIEDWNVLGELDSLIQRTKDILDKAENKGRLNVSLSAIRELRGSYELISRIAFSLHSARMQELELERERSGSRQREEEEEFMQKIRDVLSDSELHLYQKLLEKIEAEDPEMEVVESYRDTEEMEYLMSLEREDWSKRGHVGEVTADKHKPAFEMDDEPEPDLDDDEDEDEPAPNKGGMHRTKPPAKRRGQSEEEDPRPKCEREMKPKDPPKTSVQRVLREFD